MTNIIDFKTPAQLREELGQKEEEIQSLKTQLANVSAVKEMMILQSLDLKEHIDSLISQMQVIRGNVENLVNKLSS